MLEKLDAIGARALEDIRKAAKLDELEQFRVSILGKKGALSEVLRGMGALSAEERPRVGARANEWKQKIETALSERQSQLADADLESRLASERLDVTAPSLRPFTGALHPVTLTTRKMIAALSRLGFDVTTGPEVETEYLCFEAVNIPADHPARDMQDTFFLGPGVVLRTHTSPVQMRTMLSRPAPVRILCPGAVYRCDYDATHLPMFHQIEGLWVDRGVRMSDLKGTLDFFASEIFGAGTKTRFRPSYFPFVEPGVEVDVSCPFCPKQGDCKVCKSTRWIEIMGAGMVHPRLFEAAGYKDRDLTGFAFGMGVERVAMLLHRIPDLRLFNQGDLRFLSQFAGA